jgi:thiol:disulfide interchange protein
MTEFMKIAAIIAVSAVLINTLYQKFKTVDFTSDNPEGIQFHQGNWNEALQIAQESEKLIFLDVYATWCGPCKKLKTTTFANAEVGTYFTQNFINVAVDGEAGEGIELAKKYGVRGYPTLLFINSKGEVVKQTAGYHNPSQLLKLGETVLKSKQP